MSFTNKNKNAWKDKKIATLAPNSCISSPPSKLVDSSILSSFYINISSYCILKIMGETTTFDNPMLILKKKLNQFLSFVSVHRYI